MQSKSNYAELVVTDNQGNRILITIGQLFGMAIDPVIRSTIMPNFAKYEFLAQTIRDQDQIEDLKFIFFWLAEFCDLKLAGC